MEGEEEQRGLLYSERRAGADVRRKKEMWLLQRAAQTVSLVWGNTFSLRSGLVGLLLAVGSESPDENVFYFFGPFEILQHFLYNLIITVREKFGTVLFQISGCKLEAVSA